MPSCKDEYMIGGHDQTSRYRTKLIKDQKQDLSAKILGKINSGDINEKGVHGLADSLHISERHLRRIVQARTGTSPLHLNQAMRLGAAKSLVTQTKLPIIDIAFMAEFSSLRQFNDVFKEAFKISPRGMRKAALIARIKKVAKIALPRRLSHSTMTKFRLSNN